MVGRDTSPCDISADAGVAAPTRFSWSRRAVRLLAVPIRHPGPNAPAAVVREHRVEQERWQEAARQLWQNGDWVFTSRVGAPLNPSSDYHRWKALLKEAGVRDGRLHDARHTAATVLLVLGVPERTVMGIMGWSSIAMAARYQYVTDPIRRQVADQVDGLLWSDDRARQNDN